MLKIWKIIIQINAIQKSVTEGNIAEVEIISSHI